jgi:hypothetical protein
MGIAGRPSLAALCLALLTARALCNTVSVAQTVVGGAPASITRWGRQSGSLSRLPSRVQTHALEPHTPSEKRISTKNIEETCCRERTSWQRLRGAPLRGALAALAFAAHSHAPRTTVLPPPSPRLAHHLALVDARNKTVCGASLIRPHVALTAAHCLPLQPGDRIVAGGCCVAATNGTLEASRFWRPCSQTMLRGVAAVCAATLPVTHS